jgi:hypothetical protein
VRSRDGSKRPCTYCGIATLFERERIGARGGSHGWEPCCIPCGERPARRASFAANPSKRQPAQDGSSGGPLPSNEQTSAQLSLEAIAS